MRTEYDFFIFIFQLRVRTFHENEDILASPHNLNIQLYEEDFSLEATCESRLGLGCTKDNKYK